MKENPRKNPSNKYPDKNIPLRDPDPTNDQHDEKKDPADRKQYFAALLKIRLM